MKSHTTWILLLMISVLLSACAGSDPLLASEFPDTSQMALAKPLVPGLNAPEPSTEEESISDDVQQSPSEEETTTAAVEPPEDPPVSLLPAKQTNPSPPEPAQTSSRPIQRVPSTTESTPCNEVDRAMIKSFEDEIADLDVFLEGLSDILERGEVRKEIKEKKRDLRKYKKDHGCK